MALRTKGRLRRSHFYWHLVFFSLVLAAIFILVRGLQPVLTPVAAALVLSYLLDPAVTWLERRLRWARWLGTLMLFIMTLVMISAVMLLVIPVLAKEISDFRDVAPTYIEKIRASLIPWIESTFEISIPNSLHELTTRLGADMKAVASNALAPLGGVAGEMAQRAASLFSTLGTLMLVPIFTFYFLPNFPGILKNAESLIPRRYLDWVRETSREIDRALASWIRGQVTVIAVLAVLYSIGLSIVGIKMAVLIGMLTGLLAFIPYVGVVIGLSMALLVCLLEYSGLGKPFGVIIVFAVIQIGDGLFLTPRIVGEKTGLGPVGVLLALMLGGTLFGFVGVLLAVPTAAALVVVLKRGLQAYKKSLFYQKGYSEDLADESSEATPRS